ncbi:cheY-like receiver [Vibrio sp. JCM 19236]|nr:cheY-like receiver [Vibrio sp. JCM 19236]
MDSKYRTKLHTEAELLKQRLIDIEMMIKEVGVESAFSSLDSLNAVNNYLESFDDIADTLMRIYGQDKTDGLVDDLQKESIRFQRLILRESNSALNQQMLVIQESMFNLFRDLSSENKQQVDSDLQKLKQLILEVPDSLVLEEEYAQFDDAFLALHNEIESFGYDHNSGQLGAMRETIHGVEHQLEALYVNVPKLIISKLEMFRLYYYAIAALLCLSIVGVIALVIRSITKLETGLVTSQKRERDANKAKSSFLANMSHEIRTPLNGSSA